MRIVDPTKLQIVLMMQWRLSSRYWVFFFFPSYSFSESSWKTHPPQTRTETSKEEVVESRWQAAPCGEQVKDPREAEEGRPGQLSRERSVHEEAGGGGPGRSGSKQAERLMKYSTQLRHVKRSSFLPECLATLVYTHRWAKQFSNY